MSFLRNKAERYKKSSSKRYRVSIAPYNNSKISTSTTGVLFDKSKSMSGRTLDKYVKEMRDAYQERLKGYTSAQKQAIAAVREEIGWGGTFVQPDHFELQEDDLDGDWVDEETPIFFLSIPVVRKNSQNNLSQSWAERLAREQLAWEENMSNICDGLLSYTRAGPPSPPSSPIESESAAHTFSILCINLTTKERITFTSATPDTHLVVTLARHGYIPPSPSSPSIAIHIDVLRYCMALRRHASSVSIESMAEVLCEIHNVTVYARHFRTQLSAALDAYLAVMRMIDSRLAKFLSRDKPDSRMAHACAACTYCLDGEPALKFYIMLTCDGNDSLKRIANASTVDHRTLVHEYFLDSGYVDQFANEVKRKQKKKVAKSKTNESQSNKGQQETHASTSTVEPDLPETGAAVLEKEPDSEEKELDEEEEAKETACEKRWKNAQADSSSRSAVVFDETGIFAVSCRHGFVMLVEDMRQSGELSKYGLAAVDKLAQVFGDNLLIGYDIGCTFGITASRSPLVGPRVEKHNIKFVVGSFHGYAHNRKCQLSNHPLNVEGAGLESFEQNEQLFSVTNAVALTTRHASPFHRRQLIALRLSAWDHNRRCSLGSVLKARYIRALRILETLPNEIQKLKPELTDDDWKRMFLAECAYFESVKESSPESTFAMLYVKRLRVLAEKEKAFQDVFQVKTAHTLSSHIDMYRKHPSVQGTNKENQYQDAIAAQTRKVEAQRLAASEQLQAIQVEVAAMEKEHGIFPRWEPGCPEWTAAVKREALEDYHYALRELESLVVQRIAELEKSNSIGLGYKVRTQISKAIQRREKAIHHALHRYNEAARAVDPPRQTLEFEDLTNRAYQSDFDFLKYSEHGALDAEWAQPANRRCVEAWQKIERAKEEIIRLNVEIRRVRTHIRDEEQFLSQEYMRLLVSNPDLAHVLLNRLQLTIRINRKILGDLEEIAKLKGFTGDLTCGVRVTSKPSPDASPATQNPNNIAEILSNMGLDNEVSIDREDIPETELSDAALRQMGATMDTCRPM